MDRVFGQKAREIATATENGIVLLRLCSDFLPNLPPGKSEAI